MSLIINIESSTKVCSVALSDNGKLISLKETDDKEYTHSKFLTVFIEQIFEETGFKATDLSAVAVSKGPGSYTGLRIGVSTAKGIAYATNKPLIATDTLQAMALEMSNKVENITENILYCPMIDARRMEVYTSFYTSENKQIVPVSADIITENSYSDLLEKNKIYFFGDGSGKCKDIIKHENAIFVDNINPSAKNMITLSLKAFKKEKFEDTAYFEPFYLKDFIATIPKKKF